MYMCMHVKLFCLCMCAPGIYLFPRLHTCTSCTYMYTYSFKHVHVYVKGYILGFDMKRSYKIHVVTVHVGNLHVHDLEPQWTPGCSHPSCSKGATKRLSNYKSRGPQYTFSV